MFLLLLYTGQFIPHEWFEPDDVNLLSHLDALIQSDGERHITMSFNSWITVHSLSDRRLMLLLNIKSLSGFYRLLWGYS